MLPEMICKLVEIGFRQELPHWLEYPVGLVQTVLGLGLVMVAIELSEKKHAGWGDFFFYARKELLGKALVLALLLWAIPEAVLLIPKAAGIPLEAAGLAPVAVLLEKAVEIGVELLLFAAVYRFAVHSEDSPLRQVKVALEIGWEHFWNLLVFKFWVSVPLLGAMVALSLLLALELTGFSVILLTVALMAFAFFYIPYFILAEAIHGLELVEDRDREEAKQERRRDKRVKKEARERRMAELAAKGAESGRTERGEEP